MFKDYFRKKVSSEFKELFISFISKMKKAIGELEVEAKKTKLNPFDDIAVLVAKEIINFIDRFVKEK
ncbi:hypothetical protein ES702_04957 [subsurface metagenome]